MCKSSWKWQINNFCSADPNSSPDGIQYVQPDNPGRNVGIALMLLLWLQYHQFLATSYFSLPISKWLLISATYGGLKHAPVNRFWGADPHLLGSSAHLELAQELKLCQIRVLFITDLQFVPFWDIIIQKKNI